jgi:hypothetical protein
VRRYDAPAGHEDGRFGHRNLDSGEAGARIDGLVWNFANGTVTYKADRVVSHGQGKCDMQSMDVTPFGPGQIAPEWKDSCGGGEMTPTLTVKPNMSFAQPIKVPV